MAVVNTAITPLTPTPAAVVVVSFLKLTGGHVTVNIIINFMLQSNTTLLLDIDECRIQTHQCEQLCMNTNGSYQCSCYPSFYLGNDGRSCFCKTAIVAYMKILKMIPKALL